MVSSLVWPTLFSYFANLVTDRVLAIGDSVYSLNWYDQPVGIQKYIVLMVVRSQERVQFTGLSLISCSIEVFGKVCVSCSIFLNSEMTFWIIIDLFHQIVLCSFTAIEVGKFILFDFQTPLVEIKFMFILCDLLKNDATLKLERKENRRKR